MDTPDPPAVEAPLPDDVPGDPPRKLHGYIVPVMSFDSDDGLGMGIRGELSRVEAGHAPYLDAWMIHLHATLNGYQHDRIRYDRVDFGPGGRLRFTGNLSYRKWKNDGWYGLGNGTTLPTGGDAKVDRYTLEQPFLYMVLRTRIEGPWSVFGAVTGKVTKVTTYADSLLEQQQPHGMDGGPSVQGVIGLVVDTRDPESTPDHGVFAEISARAGPRIPWILPRGFMYGVSAAFRGYQAIGPRETFAFRAMVDDLWGDVPFYEMDQWGGSTPIVGMGGSDTLRGVPFGRWHGPGKAVANTEMRIDVADTHAGKAPLRLDVVPFADAGFVFGAGPYATAPAPAFPIHPSVGIGGRAIYDTTFVGRVDFAVAPDDPSWDWGFYLAFDHMF